MAVVIGNESTLITEPPAGLTLERRFPGSAAEVKRQLLRGSSDMQPL